MSWDLRFGDVPRGRDSRTQAGRDRPVLHAAHRIGSRALTLDVDRRGPSCDLCVARRFPPSCAAALIGTSARNAGGGVCWAAGMGAEAGRTPDRRSPPTPPTPSPPVVLASAGVGCWHRCVVAVTAQGTLTQWAVLHQAALLTLVAPCWLPRVQGRGTHQCSGPQNRRPGAGETTPPAICVLSCVVKALAPSRGAVPPRWSPSSLPPSFNSSCRRPVGRATTASWASPRRCRRSRGGGRRDPEPRHVLRDHVSGRRALAGASTPYRPPSPWARHGAVPVKVGDPLPTRGPSPPVPPHPPIPSSPSRPRRQS